ncbi:MAG: thiopurine S-methyltransferase [Halieaceae bacterium]|jgi:thiopurine S-methyltransferase|nr:thiopurine S-methyltransferase [Halieaceae bacterium]
MEPDFWNKRWQAGQIGFHAPDVHWALSSHWPSLGHPVDQPVLVPLCGKSLDLRWLAERGHAVTGIELNSTAVSDFFREWQRLPRSLTRDSSLMRGFEADGVQLWQGDFFDFQTEQRYPSFYDRAALIALPAAMRSDYARKLRACLDHAATGLLVTLEYDQNLKDGPPFSVSFEEVDSMAGFHAAPLERRDVLGESPKFRQSGVDRLYETVYRLTAV